MAIQASKFQILRTLTWIFYHTEILITTYLSSFLIPKRMSRIFYRLFSFLVPIFFVQNIQANSSDTAIMPLSEVRPGMKGEWKTVVSGTQIQSFPLEVIDVVPNFVGPKQSVIFCQSLDEHQMDMGTVAGMSGSPVYIDGKLVGAYAYGFPWPKQQALIGVSPIEEMLKVLDHSESSGVMGAEGPGIPGSAPGVLPLGDEERKNISATPILLSVAGFSSESIAEFSKDWERLGFMLKVSAAAGGAQTNVEASNESDMLIPGSAVAAVLLSGDFKMAAAGTVTWKEGSRVLAMGHPFLKQGPVRIPMALAEIVTIVQSYETSFKLAKIGDTVGSFFQDRLTALAGEIGVFAPTTNLLINVTTADGQKRSYSGDLFQNRDLGPLVAAMALLQSLNSTLDTAFEQSYFLTSKIQVEGYDPIIQERVACGPLGARQLSREFLEDFRFLLNNKFEFPKVKSIEFDVSLQQGTRHVELLEVQVVSGKPLPGSLLELQLKLKDYQGPVRVESLKIPLPHNRPIGDLELRIGNAKMADAAYRGKDPRLGFRSLRDVINYLRLNHKNGAFYVQLVQEAPGMQFAGRPMMDLPSSTLSLYTSPKSWFKAGTLDSYVLFEKELPQHALCVGGPCIMDCPFE